jgi:serralysin
MATVKLGPAFNITNPSTYDVDDMSTGVTRTSSATGFSISDALGNSATVTGNGFRYGADGDWIGGIAHSLTIRKSGQVVLEATGLSIDGNSNAYDTGFGGEAPGMQAEVAYWFRGNDTIIATTGNQYIKGFGGNDIIQGAAGNDIIDGGAGTDTAVYAGSAASYQILKTSNGYLVNGGTEGGDTLFNIERIKFDDKTIAFDTSGNAGQAYRLYQAAFNRTPDTGGLSFQTKALDDGWGLASIAQNFIDSPEFSSRYGALNNTQFVTQLYANVLHRAPETEGLNFHVNNLANGMSRAQVLVGFSESPENQAAIIGVIQNGMELIG